MSETDPKSSFNRGFLTALFSALAQSSGSVFIRYLSLEYQLPALVLSFWRILFVVIILGSILLIFNPESLKGLRSHLPLLAVFGFLMSLNMALYTVSVVINGAAVATALVYISGTFSAILGRFFLREELNLLKILAVIISFAGCVLVVNAYDPAAWSLNTTGILTGILAGLGYAIYGMVGRVTSQRGINPWASILAGFTIGACFMLLFNLAPGIQLPGAAAEPRDMFWLGSAWRGWGILLLMAAGPTLVGFGTYNISLRHLPASIANLITTIEPVFTTIIAYLFLGESLTIIQVIGGLMIIGGVGMLQVSANGKQQRTAAVQFAE